MTVVTNTSPLNYLLLLGEARVRPPLFGLVHLPAAVRAELAAARGLVDFRDALHRLGAINFRATLRLVAEFLRRDKLRRQQPKPR